MTQPTNHKSEIRVVVLDVDGTLLNSDHAITPRVAETLKTAVAKGVQIVLATGKTRYSTLKLLDELGIRTPGIYLQGLAIYDAGGAVLQQLTLEPSLVRQVVTFGEDRGFTMMLYSGERILVRSRDEQLEARFALYHEIAPEAIGALQNVVGTLPINKVIAVGAPRAVTALRWQLTLQVGGAGRIMQAGVPEMLELLPPGASKGWALRQLLKIIKVDAAHVMAVGDAENDIEMIQLAGVGVAMGQAAQDVKDAADYVTASNDADGVADAFERFVLTKPESEQAEARAEGEAPVVIEPADKTEEAAS
ncbi:MAG: HAD family hydrolase [Anaerolineae bacterium]